MHGYKPSCAFSLLSTTIAKMEGHRDNTWKTISHIEIIRTIVRKPLVHVRKSEKNMKKLSLPLFVEAIVPTRPLHIAENPIFFIILIITAKRKL